MVAYKIVSGKVERADENCKDGLVMGTLRKLREDYGFPHKPIYWVIGIGSGLILFTIALKELADAVQKNHGQSTQSPLEVLTKESLNYMVLDNLIEAGEYKIARDSIASYSSPLRERDGNSLSEEQIELMRWPLYQKDTTNYKKPIF